MCVLYKQRETPSIKLTALQLITVIKNLLDNHLRVIQKMNDLGDPFEGECTDEGEYAVCIEMCAIYAETLCILFLNQGKQFNADKTKVDGIILSDLIIRFNTEVKPNLIHAYLYQKCKLIEF